MRPVLLVFGFIALALTGCRAEGGGCDAAPLGIVTCQSGLVCLAGSSCAGVIDCPGTCRTICTHYGECPTGWHCATGFHPRRKVCWD